MIKQYLECKLLQQNMHLKQSIYIPNLIFKNIYKINYSFCRKISLMIESTKTNEQLITLLTKYHGNFNLQTMLALLKKIHNKNNFKIINNQQLHHLTYQQLQYSLHLVKSINYKNYKQLVNIIDYMGKLGKRNINQSLKSLDLKKILLYVSQLQFSLFFIGLLKLNLIQLLVAQDNFNSFVKTNVTSKFHFGLNVAIWRNLLICNKSNKQLNIFFSQNIINCAFQRNIKDFIYLLYCYLQTHNHFQTSQLLDKIVQFSQRLTIFPSINMFEFSIFTSTLIKFKTLTKINLPSIIYSQIQNYFSTLLHSSRKITLTQLEIGFTSYHSFIQNPTDDIQIKVTNRYLQLLQYNQQYRQSFQQTIGIFYQLIIILNQQYQKQKTNLWNSSQIKRITTVAQKILQIYFNEKTQYLNKMANNQFKKLLSGLSMCMQQKLPIQLSQHNKQQIKQSILGRKNQTKKQLRAIVLALPKLKIKNKQLCLFIKQQSNKQLLKYPDFNFKKFIFKSTCLLGYSHQLCLHCSNNL